MRIAILSLFLCAGTTAFCQTSAPAPAIPNNPWQTPPGVVPPRIRDFSKLPPGWHAGPLIQPRMMLVPKAVDTTRSNDAQIDPKIIVHPPASSIGVQPPGTAVAQNEYPGLRMLPIESARSHIEAIPTNGRSIDLTISHRMADDGTAMIRSPGN